MNLVVLVKPDSPTDFAPWRRMSGFILGGRAVCISALDGYGVYVAAARITGAAMRIVDAADSTARPAAPGSLLSVLGAHVNSANGGSLVYPVLMAKRQSNRRFKSLDGA